MQLSHSRPVASAVFDDPNLVSCAGLVPMAVLAHKCGLAELADEHLSVPTDKGANAGAKVSALVAGMVAGADSIDDMALLRHAAIGGIGGATRRSYPTGPGVPRSGRTTPTSCVGGAPAPATSGTSTRSSSASTARSTTCGVRSTSTATYSTSWSNLAGMPRPPRSSSADCSRACNTCRG
jgi:hypothetical protein